MNYILMKMENLLNYKLNHYDVYIFDLDNTLFKEEDYLFKAYEKIALVFSKSQNNYASILNYLIFTFRNEGRTNIFDKLCVRFNIDRKQIEKCLNILRTFKVEQPIVLYSNMYYVLNYLICNNKKIIILTNGNIEQQNNKINSIDWKGYLKNIEIYYANKFQPKPSNMALEYIIDKYKYDRDKILFIGDSNVDRICAIRSKVDFILKNNN